MGKYADFFNLIDTKMSWGSDSDFFFDVISKRERKRR